MNPEDVADENLREKLDSVGAFADKSVWEKELRQAMKNKQKVTIHAQGTYKGVTGFIQKIDKGYVYINTPVTKSIIPIQRIQGLDLFKPDEQEG